MPILETDADGVVRGYRTHALARNTGSGEGDLAPYATLVWSTKSADAGPIRCGFDEGGTSGDAVDRNAVDRVKKIRFVADENLRRLPAGQVIAAARDREGPIFQSLQQQEILKGKRVIVGGVYRHARDQYATPIGILYGAEILAHAIETEGGNEIHEVGALGVRVGRARWNHPADGGEVFAAAAPVGNARVAVATAAAAGLTCWLLLNYYGYFLGVFGSLCGAVLGAVLGAVWEPLSADWNAWWSEFNRRRRSRRVVTSILIVASSLIAGRAVDAMPVDAEPARRALVIGIATYVELAELKEAAGDAMKIADALAREESGFVVTSIIDADTEAEALRRGVKTFVASINPGDAVVIYYAGHGVQASGTNYLLPADFPKNPGRLKTHAIDIKALLKDVEARQPLVRVLVLDACRNNPFAGSNAWPRPDGLGRLRHQHAHRVRRGREQVGWRRPVRHALCQGARAEGRQSGRGLQEDAR